MSLQSLPIKEFCYEINFLLITQAGGDTDKMETCKMDFTYDEDNIYFSDEPLVRLILTFTRDLSPVGDIG